MRSTKNTGRRTLDLERGRTRGPNRASRLTCAHREGRRGQRLISSVSQWCQRLQQLKPVCHLHDGDVHKIRQAVPYHIPLHMIFQKGLSRVPYRRHKGTYITAPFGLILPADLHPLIRKRTLPLANVVSPNTCTCTNDFCRIPEHLKAE